jgi:hypothetical protein
MRRPLPLVVYLCLISSLMGTLSACSDSPEATSPVLETLPELTTEASEKALLLSTRNTLNQARLQYFPLAGRLLMIPSDTAAYQELTAQVLPLLLSAANSLNNLQKNIADPEVQNLKSEFDSLYAEISEQMDRGVQLNLNFYQNQFENTISLPVSQSEAGFSPALNDIAQLFESLEQIERYQTTLAPFTILLSSKTPAQQLQTLANQQTILISGVLRFSAGLTNPQSLRQSYEILARSLSQPALLNAFYQLALRVFPENQIAYRRDEVVSGQSDPNKIVMVIREAPTQYRQLQIENGQIKNQLVQDQRGLTAADFLNQSQVVVISPSVTP